MNRTKRLIKAPKIYWGDTGVALHLAETEEAGGAHLENLVLHDLLAWRDVRIEHAELGYWRTAVGEEVDFVIEAGGKLLPIGRVADARTSYRTKLDRRVAPPFPHLLVQEVGNGVHQRLNER